MLSCARSFAISASGFFASHRAAANSALFDRLFGGRAARAALRDQAPWRLDHWWAPVPGGRQASLRGRDRRSRLRAPIPVGKINAVETQRFVHPRITAGDCCAPAFPSSQCRRCGHSRRSDRQQGFADVRYTFNGDQICVSQLTDANGMDRPCSRPEPLRG